MKYQLWDMVSYGYGEPMVPFSLIKESENFEDIHSEFIKMKGIGVIILDKKTTPLKVDPTKKIYESPDGGKTIYERHFGDHINKKKIK